MIVARGPAHTHTHTHTHTQREREDVLVVYDVVFFTERKVDAVHNRRRVDVVVGWIVLINKRVPSRTSDGNKGLSIIATHYCAEDERARKNRGGFSPEHDDHALDVQNRVVHSYACDECASRSATQRSIFSTSYVQ